MGVDEEREAWGDKEKGKERGGREERQTETASQKERPTGVRAAGRD